MRFPVMLFALVSWVVPACDLARAAVFPLWPDTQVVGEIGHVRARGYETLRDIAARFDVGLSELERLNVGVDGERPGSGTWITLPTQFVLPDAPREGLVINVAEPRVYYYVRSILGRGAEVMTFPAMLGRRDWTGRLGATRIEAKLKDSGSPMPAKHGGGASGAPAGATRPADELALRLGIPDCLIQATHPWGASDGRSAPPCVGLPPKDLALLFEEVGEDTPVSIINQPYKAGWRDGALYLESHAPYDGEASRSITRAVRTIIHATAERKPPIDWEAVRRSAEEATGVPVRISR